MATLKQIEANRLNARKSTGPRTAAGKAASRMNALKTGIDASSETIRGEDPKTLAALAAEYYDRFRPATPEQRALVDTLISSDWLLRRLRRADAQVWEQAFERMERWDSDTEAPLGEAFRSTDRTFSRLQRRIDSAQRNYHRALKELQRQPPEPEIGFVPQASANLAERQPTPDSAPTAIHPTEQKPIQPFSAPISASPRLCVKSPPPQLTSPPTLCYVGLTPTQTTFRNTQ